MAGCVRYASCWYASCWGWTLLRYICLFLLSSKIFCLLQTLEEVEYDELQRCSSSSSGGHTIIGLPWIPGYSLQLLSRTKADSRFFGFLWGWMFFFFFFCFFVVIWLDWDLVLISGCNQACMGQDVHPLNHSCKTTNSFVDLVFENFPGIFPVSYSLRSPNSCSGNPVQSHRMLVTLQKSILSH
jgi:hypothetical protein